MDSHLIVLNIRPKLAQLDIDFIKMSRSHSENDELINAKAPIAFDLFAGAGGMSLGAQYAGVQVLEAVDIDKKSCLTYALNHPNTRVRNLDISEYCPTLPKELRGTRELVIFGGPPCQGFSTSNQQTRSKSNPKNWLFTHYMRLAQNLRPDWIILENVKGLIETEGGFFFDRIHRSLRGSGYKVDAWVLNSVDFGVPQRRARLFIVGHLHGRPPSQPTPKQISVTVRDAIGDLPTLENGASIDELPYSCPPHSSYSRSLRGRRRICTGHLVTASNDVVISRYATIPPGGNWKSIPFDLLGNYRDASRCHTRIYHRLSEDCAAPVIGNFRKNMLIHPTQHRGLSVREAARLQSFPDQYVFCGSIGFQQQQVGNAVPPLLAQAVFESIFGEKGGNNE